MWSHLAERLPIGKERSFGVDAGLIGLAFAVSDPGKPVPAAQLAEALNELGWRQSDGTPLRDHNAIWAISETFSVLANVSSGPVGWAAATP